jgi:predicted small metal-binding protein
VEDGGVKAFRCGDVVPGCNRVFSGVDRADILAQVAEHARADHAVDMNAALTAAVEAKLVEGNLVEGNLVEGRLHDREV